MRHKLPGVPACAIFAYRATSARALADSRVNLFLLRGEICRERPPAVFFVPRGVFLGQINARRPRGARSHLGREAKPRACPQARSRLIIGCRKVLRWRDCFAAEEWASHHATRHSQRKCKCHYHTLPLAQGSSLCSPLLLHTPLRTRSVSNSRPRTATATGEGEADDQFNFLLKQMSGELLRAQTEKAQAAQAQAEADTVGRCRLTPGFRS